MSKTAMMTIAMPQGGLLDKAAMKTEADVPVQPHQIVDVPEAYGRTLVDNRFAYEAEKPKASKAGKAKGVDDGKAAAEQAAAIAAAEKDVEDAKVKLAAAGDDMVAKQEAEAELAAAETALSHAKA